MANDIAAKLSRRSAMQGLIAVGGFWFIADAACSPHAPAPQSPQAQQPPGVSPTASAPLGKPVMSMNYTLAPLPYGYDALEPHMDAQTLRLHHDLHHAGYVKGANAAVAALKTARDAGDFKLVDYYTKNLSFHLSGHLLHTLFWQTMAPVGKGGAPSTALTKAINDAFGNLDNLKKQMSATAVSVQGSGWAVLGWSPADASLLLLQCENHEKKAVWNVVPLLVVDVWEHAYYLKYQNRRADFVNAWWNLVNWNEVSALLAKAQATATAK